MLWKRNVYKKGQDKTKIATRSMRSSSKSSICRLSPLYSSLLYQPQPVASSNASNKHLFLILDRAVAAREEALKSPPTLPSSSSPANVNSSTNPGLLQRSSSSSGTAAGGVSSSATPSAISSAAAKPSSQSTSKPAAPSKSKATLGKKDQKTLLKGIVKKKSSLPSAVVNTKPTKELEKTTVTGATKRSADAAVNDEDGTTKAEKKTKTGGSGS